MKVFKAFQTFSELCLMPMKTSNLFIWGLHRFQHCAGHITTNGFVGRGNQYIQLVKVLYFELQTIDK